MGTSMLITMLVLSLAGIYVCRLIILHIMEKDSPVGAKLCSTSGKFDCDKVLGSGPGKLSKNLHLGDIGLAYFISQSLFIVLEMINGKTTECMAIVTLPCLFAFALTFASLLYQAVIIKAWCKMCLIIVAVIWLQELVMITNLAMGSSNSFALFGDDISVKELIPSILMFVASLLIASTWLFIKPVITTANEVKITKTRLALWKNNAQVFMVLLKTQRIVKNDPWEDDFFLGNKDGRIQLAIALNPYCAPCAREYKNIMDLLKLFPKSLGVTIRFLVNTDTENRPTQATRYLLHQYASTPKDGQPKILEHWFGSMSLKEWEKSSPGLNLDQDTLLKKHQQWFGESRITETPTTFINGYEFPKPYIIEDLKKLIKPLRPLMVKQQQNEKIAEEQNED